MTLDNNKTTGDDISAAEWNESATAANKVTDSTLVAANVTDFDTEVSNNTSVAANTAKVGVTDELSKSGGTMTGDLNMGSQELTAAAGVKFDTATAPSVTPEGTIWWNGDEYTINVETGLGPTIQVGQETLLLYYNDTGVQIDNFSVLHLKSGTTVGGVLFPTPELADASKWETTQGTLTVATQDIPNGQLGFATRFGKARGGDTSGLAAGAQLWLSATTPGALTDVKPTFPDYSVSMGGAFNSAAAPNGEVLVSVTKGVDDTFNDAWDGAVRETFSFTVASNGTTITGSLENGGDNTRDLTLLFSDGFYTLDTTPAATLTLTAGTDINPQTNYVYIDQATKTLQTSTSDWPSSTEHCKIAYILLRSAATTQTDGALVNQNWNDHLKKEDDNGHILHITERLRRENAKWESGVEASVSIVGASSPDDVYVSTTSGTVYQLHTQTFPAQDMSTGDHVHVVNDSTTPYVETTNLNTLLTDSTGSSMSGKSFSLVLWGVNNKTGEDSHLMVNLPSGSYNSSSLAITDASGYSDYSIPKTFQGTGFLIARLTFSHTTAGGGAWTLEDTEDLRGFTPNVSAGGGVGGAGVTTWTGLTDTPSSYTGQAGKFPAVNVGETGLEFVSAGAVDSVFGRTGAIVAVSGDYEASEVTNAFDKTVDDTDDITEGATNKFLTAAEETKLGHISVTQAVDLDTMESNIATNNAKVGVTDEISNVSEDTTPQLGGNLDENGKHQFIIPSSTLLISSGDVANFDGTNWAPADASASSTATKQIGMYDGTNIITKGIYTTTGLTSGAIYYISETGGDITVTPPSTSLSIVRVVGYALSTTQLYVNPDNTWVEVA
jgi:hypothetical protein